MMRVAAVLLGVVLAVSVQVFAGPAVTPPTAVPLSPADAAPLVARAYEVTRQAIEEAKELQREVDKLERENAVLRAKLGCS